MKGAYARGVSRRACEGAEEPVWGRRRGLWVYVGPAALGLTCWQASAAALS